MRHLRCCRAGLLLLPLLAATPWGTASVAAGEPLSPAAIQAKYAGRDPILPDNGEFAVFPGKAEEPKQDCAGLTEGRVMTALVFGQSNAANTVDPGYDSGQPVYAYYNGTCQKAHDTMPGASGSKGSTWPRLGDRAVASGLFDAVLFADIARGGSSILNWGPGGALNPILLGTLDDLVAKGLSPTHIFFHQGESDCALGIDPADYAAMLEAIITQIRQRVGDACEIVVARASLYYDPALGGLGDPAGYRSCPALTAVQTEAADPARKVFSGPNTDLIVPWFDRNDGYHFSAKAADHFSAAWMPLLARGGDMAQATP
ncbi:sialate O-acetylesterase [Solidesulfovibrio aerotolerans]|uniref:sialate O-acetylesterase n=1 Tax=Solidesulfovibrio aerotolerans TaxID=295255 RepID=UPI001FE6ABF5|nr:sialate O-acetylesterase [Solidesulfovibrio aerotolerans]